MQTSRMYLLIMASLLLFFSGCREELMETEPQETSKTAPDPSNVETFVKYVVLKNDWQHKDDDLFHSRSKWDEIQQQRSVIAAMPLLKTIYTEEVLDRVTTFIAMERDDGYPRLRKWLSEFKVDPYATSRMRLLFSVHNADNDLLPEWFDILTKLVTPDGFIARFGHASMNPGYPSIEWTAGDEAANALWTDLSEFFPEWRRWRCYFCDANPEKPQKEWRVEIPKWLKEHPEARSYWIQKYYKNLKGRYSPVHWPEETARVGKTIDLYEKEFATELADRRGICAGYLDGSPRQGSQ